MCRRLYAWNDIPIELLCHDRELADRLDHCWRTFFGLTPLRAAPSAAGVTIQLQAEPVHHMVQPGQKQVWRQGHASVWQTAVGLCLQSGGASLLIGVERGQASGSISSAFWHYPLAEQRDFFTRSLLLLLRRLHIYGLHANGISTDDRSLLLIGPSGSGKTTLTLSLGLAGWNTLGDDVVVLRRTEEGVTALAMQRGFACTEQTVAFFPQLSTDGAPRLDPVRQKQWLAPTTDDKEQMSNCCRPSVLLFPTIAAEPHSRLTPLDTTQTMLGLMEQSAALLVEPRAAAYQMAMLRQLGRQARSYRLVLGRDVYADPPAVAALLGAL